MTKAGQTMEEHPAILKVRLATALVAPDAHERPGLLEWPGRLGAQ